jgi:chromosome segregation ATPase
MSTAGKVLVVLVALILLPWIWLYAKVYELNSGYGQQVQRLTTQIEDLEKQIALGSQELDTRIAEAHREQAAYDNDLAVLRTRIADVEKRESTSREALERIKLQIATLEESTKDAQLTVATRLQEKADTMKAVADTEQLVKSLEAAVQSRLDQLDNLRNTFLTTMEENRKMLNRLDSASTGRVRRASLVR